jgi:hypothetical protein
MRRDSWPQGVKTPAGQVTDLNKKNHQNQYPPHPPRASGDGVLRTPELPASLWPILRGVSFRFVPMFAAGKLRSHPLVANYQRCSAPVRVVFGVGSAPLFDQHGSGAREAYAFSNRLSFIILVARGGQASLSAILRGISLQLVCLFAGFSQPPAKLGFSPRRCARFQQHVFSQFVQCFSPTS